MNPMKKVKGLRVICDGSVHGTKVLDSQGNPIGMIQSLQINIDHNKQVPTMVMTMFFSELDIVIPEEGITVELGKDAEVVPTP